MAAKCLDGEYWDPLLNSCLHCHLGCKQPKAFKSCTNHCQSAKCMALGGHYYDRLLKTCVRCTAVCGRHPAECSQYCTPPTPLTTEKLLITSRERHSNGLEDSALLLYPLLTLSLVLLFASLSLAVIVFLRGSRVKRSKPQPVEARDMQESVIQHVHDDGQPWQSSKEIATNNSHPTDREPSDDSIPIETCVCVHCFPDLKTVSQSNQRPFSLYPNVTLHKIQVQKQSLEQTDVNSSYSGVGIPKEAAMR